jgi:drug/metabolite transporter (DMT)-like permease
MNNFKNTYLSFNEQLEHYHYLGIIVVFGGVYLVKKKSKYEKKN